METIIINENERALLFKNGKYEKLLGAGKYHLFGGRTVEVCDISFPIAENSLKILERDTEAMAQISVCEVKNSEMCLHYINGIFNRGYGPGKYAFWSVSDKHEFRVFNANEPEVTDEIPRACFDRISNHLFSKFTVPIGRRGILYYNGQLQKELPAGTYYFWNNGTVVNVETVDTRQCSLDIRSQSVLTKDKVELRINFVCSYRVTDCVKALNEIDDFQSQLYTAAQLALRSLAGNYKMDELLENREQLSAETCEVLREKAKSLYVEVLEAGIRDIILPGEISGIMNTVLAAEKRAQANVITRREEVASTRSLLNTAKLMDENKTLYKLKELEYIEKICENVGNISVESGKGLLSQLAGVLTEK